MAAWVRFPDLTLQPLPQEYIRLADRQYRYSSRSGAFKRICSWMMTILCSTMRASGNAQERTNDCDTPLAAVGYKAI